MGRTQRKVSAKKQRGSGGGGGGVGRGSGSGGGSSMKVSLLSLPFPPLSISCHSPLPVHLEQAKTIAKSSSVLCQIEL